MSCISVIFPVYKVEPYIHRCVDSILRQSYRDFELILVDDGSPDNCGAMCDEYAAKDDRIHVIHRENGGLSAARNSGIDWVLAHSHSQWLCFVDSDDWVHEDYLGQLYKAVMVTGCKISACGFYHTSGEDFPPIPEETPLCLSADDYYCADRAGHGVAAVAWNKLYHRSLLEDIRYPVGKLHEDEFTTYKVIYRAGRIAAVTARLYAYYQNPAGIMKSQWKPGRLDSVEAIEGQIAYARKKGLPELLKKATRHYIYCVYEQLGYARDWEDPAKTSVARSLRKKLRFALRQGKAYGHLPLSWDNLWVYEEAYPMKPVWWLLYKARQIAGK